MTLRLVIVDDEELARRGIRKRLKDADDVEIVAECRNAREAIDAICAHAPDAVLLDVQMPGQSGFDVVEAFAPERRPYIIFVTAHDKFAVQAFEINALDYLLKPIDEQRLHAALARARSCVENGRQLELGRRLSAAIHQVNEAAGDQRILVRSAGRVVFVRIAEIDWIAASGDYVTIYAGNKSWLMNETITAMEKRLAPQGFARIHRSTIVNSNRIAELKSLDNGDCSVRLHNGTELRCSRNFRESLTRATSA